MKCVQSPTEGLMQDLTAAVVSPGEAILQPGVITSEHAKDAERMNMVPGKGGTKDAFHANSVEVSSGRNTSEPDIRHRSMNRTNSGCVARCRQKVLKSTVLSAALILQAAPMQ